MVNCTKLGREAPGLDWQPVPGALGKRIYDTVSAEAWAQWTAMQTMLINEYRLNLADERAQKLLMEKLEEFFFGSGAVEHPPDYVPPESSSGR
jgi:Fe-S cluster biosynthesis and repair protein YggX